jgi:hypothetical protein
MDKKTKLENEVIEKLRFLNTTGKMYRRKVHKLDNILNTYINLMKKKYINLGDVYLENMSNNIVLIFSNITNKSSFDNLEYVNIIINFYFKLLAYNYKLTKTNPLLPDYTLDEIKDMAIHR